VTSPRPPGRASHDRWLVSYADLVTLLLALFTTLYAASSLDARKLDPIASSLRSAFDARPLAAAGVVRGKPAIVPPVEIVSRVAEFEELKTRLARELDDAVRARRLEITTDGRGLVISLPEQATFPVGAADVSADARQLISRVAATIAPLPNLIRVEGHTDDVPIRTAKYDSNWELSTARASAVVALLVERVGLEASRLSAAGYGQYHPLNPNDSDAHRARNRRVDLVILDMPAAAAPSGGRSAAP